MLPVKNQTESYQIRSKRVISYSHQNSMIFSLKKVKQNLKSYWLVDKTVKNNL